MAPSIVETVVTQQRGRRLKEQLTTIALGKEVWVEYEKKGVEILKYLFERDLTVWEPGRSVYTIVRPAIAGFGGIIANGN